jgi:hypothetical protein
MLFGAAVSRRDAEAEQRIGSSLFQAARRLLKAVCACGIDASPFAFAVASPAV